MTLLSPRQREILGLVAAGRTSKEIASELGISERTVNWHISKVFGRLGASSRAEAVAITMRDDANGHGRDGHGAANGGGAVSIKNGDDAPDKERRVGRRVSLRGLALAFALTLLLGMLGGALIAGWDLSSTAPDAPMDSARPWAPAHPTAPTATTGTARPTATPLGTSGERGPAAPAEARPPTLGPPKIGVPALPDVKVTSTALPAIPSSVPLPSALLPSAPPLPSLPPALRSVP